MPVPTTVRLRTVAILVAVAALLAGAIGAAVAYFGVYDVSATKQHTRPVFRLLDYAMQRAVEVRADEIPVPDLTDRRRVVAGAAHYQAQCLQCHGAPGIAPHSIAFGMTPAPANLMSAGRSWPPGEIFWVIKNGIKMSGMPAWVYRLSDEQVWDVVAFMRAMAAMTPRDYANLTARLPQPEAAPRGQQPATAPATRPGDVAAGRRATAQFLCATCHSIPGMTGASQQVGPPLAGIGRRTFIGGVLPNTRENMVRWLKDPQAIDPLSAMPPLGIGDQEAHDIAAYLATLEDVSAK
jgi:mono/diheme cytochrome c family protein